MAHRMLRDPDADGWERADFPIVCETCLGPNPYIRMQRMEFGAECHISGRPYTKFRWRPGNDARYKGTIICQEVAKAKNVCQVCLLDLDYNLPVQARDHALGLEDEALPESDVGREFALERMSNEGELGEAFKNARANEAILKMQRTTPYYKRNRAPICSFFVKGECKRGAECPYRHEMPTTGELAQQNIKDRYFGVNDPVAKKMMGRMEELETLQPPEDTTITTLFVGNMLPDITEGDLRDAFAAHGELTKVKKVEARNCAFVTFAERAQAEEAAEKLQNVLIVRGTRLKLMWGKPQEKREGPEGAAPPQGGASGPPVGGMIPPQVQQQMGGGNPYPPSGAAYYNQPPPSRPPPMQAAYPSMDPQQQGTRVPAPGEQPQKRRMEGEGGPEPKRQGGPQMQMQPPLHFPPARPPLGYHPRGYGPPPLGFPQGPGMFGPPPGMRPPFSAAPPMGWRPPPGGGGPRPMPQTRPHGPPQGATAGPN